MSTEFFSGSLDDLKSDLHGSGLTQHNSGNVGRESVEFEQMKRVSMQIKEESDYKSEAATEMKRESRITSFE